MRRFKLQTQKQEFTLKPEDQLLLYCSHSQVQEELKDKISFLVNNELNWDHIMDMATQHRLRPLLYYNLNSICPDEIPENVLMDLKEFYQANVRKNLMLTGELVKVMGLLEDNGIKAFTYKGPVLASQAYGNIGLREFGDIDIFIDKEDALKVKDLMIGQGYEIYPLIDIIDSLYMKLESEYTFINKNTGALIEINWDFKGNFLSLPVKHNYFFNELEKREISGFEISTPSICNDLLMLCIHSAKHNWNRLIWIYDISEFIDTNIINWDIIILKSEQLKVKRILFISLILAKYLFNSPIPQNILNLIDDDIYTINLTETIKKQLFLDENINIFEKFILDLNKRENISLGLNDCFNGLTNATYTDFKDIPLPQSLFPFYSIIRPFLLLKRYGKGSI